MAGSASLRRLVLQHAALGQCKQPHWLTLTTRQPEPLDHWAKQLKMNPSFIFLKGTHQFI
jgi:hypothetical protein